MANRKIRVRSKRLSQIDDSKLALAVWLMARDLTDQADAESKPAKTDDDSAASKEAA
jgi:hypothetical protein